MLLKTTSAAIAATTAITTTTSSSLFSFSKPSLSLSKLPLYKPHNYLNNTEKSSTFFSSPRMSWLNKLGFSSRTPNDSPAGSVSSIVQGPDDDVPAPGQEFAQFGAGCFWGVELAYQRVPGVTNTEVGYSQGYLHNPTYEDVCSGTSNHAEVVRVQYDPKECSYETLLDLFWARHDPTTLNRQGNDVGTQYRSGIYFYTSDQEKAALESRDRHQKLLNRKIVTEILPAKKFYRAEEYHQQYLAKGGRFGFRQSPEKGLFLYTSGRFPTIGQDNGLGGSVGFLLWYKILPSMVAKMSMQERSKLDFVRGQSTTWSTIWMRR